MEGSNLRYITAPMVGQSDLPFRVLCRMHGATLSCTQMLMPDKLLNEQDYLEYHLKDLKTATDLGLEQPVVVQLCGNDPESIVKAGRILQNHCQGIGNIWLLNQYTFSGLIPIYGRLDLNLGCPQKHAQEGNFGAYLLGQNDWPLVEKIGMRGCKRFRKSMV